MCYIQIYKYIYTELGSVTLKCRGATATVKYSPATIATFIVKLQLFIVLQLSFIHKHLLIIKQFGSISMQLYCDVPTLTSMSKISKHKLFLCFAFST